MASVRYLVKDVDAAVAFYTQYLGFAVKMIELFEMAPRK
jgi:catechol 2,3-dioxygenase-like lactoylglutathione lyase family enzyme